ncbi:MAG: helix-turn-helix transcriptional regulator [Chlorobi bacterium]|nr:helix-turn-helix transcriptional regulator [Chlorobiota bacterium]
MHKISKELMGASSIPIILSILQKGDSYGYQIMGQLRELSKGRIEWKEGSLYPVLKKLENAGLIKSYWKIEGSQRPRKYYKLLDKGGKALKREKDDWDLMQSIFIKLWDTQESST